MIAAEDVVRTHTEFNRALTMRDFDALSKLYADEYVLVRPDGSVLSKKEVLRDLQEGGLKFTSIEIANVTTPSAGWTESIGEPPVVNCSAKVRDVHPPRELPIDGVPGEQMRWQWIPRRPQRRRV